MMRLAGRGIIYPVYSAVSQRCFHSQDKKSGNNTQKTKHRDGPGVAAVSKVSTFTGSSLGDIILPTFTASFMGLMESNLSVRALYDPGSQASYVLQMH